MSVSHQNSLQDQINKLEIQVAQLGGCVKALLETSRELYLRVEDIDDRVPVTYVGELNENHRDAS